MQSILEAQNIEKNFVQNENVVQILKDVSYSFLQNKTYAIKGISGIGKSTFIHILAGIEPVTAGQILFNGSNITNKNSLLAHSIGIVFQESFLIKELSVVENVMLKGLIKNDNYKNCHEKAMFFLKKIGLQDKANKSPAVLSGGQKGRVAILRAIFNSPKFLLADEPTGNLDNKSAGEIKDFLLQSAQDYNIGLIVSTHDIKLENSLEIILRLENRSLIVE